MKPLYPFTEPILTHSQMEQIDRLSSEKFGVLPELLMEQASQSIWDTFLQETEKKENSPLFVKPIQKEDSLLFLCGGGNNGGDGLVIACLAFEMGFHNIEVYLAKSEGTDLFHRQLKRLLALGIPIFFLDGEEDFFEPLKCKIKESNWLFDAYLGTGGRSPLRKEWQSIATVWNCQKGKRVAIDLPSGIPQTETKEKALFFETDLTLTVNFHKRSFYYPLNRMGCGKIVVCDAGFPHQAVETVLMNNKNSCFRVHSDSLWESFQVLSGAVATKNSRGRILVIAGSKKYPGAASLVVEGACFAGGGYVQLASDSSALQIALNRTPALVPIPLNEEDEKQWDLQWLNRQSVVVAGSGREENAKEEKQLNHLLHATVPLLLDAGALNLISKSPMLVDQVRRRDSLLLTPQPAELKRLLKPLKCDDLGVDSLKEKKEICSAPFVSDQTLLSVAKYYNSPILLKEAVSRVALPEGEILFYDSCRTHLAQAGSGDLLAGLVGALFSFVCSTQEGDKRWGIAAVGGCFIQGEAADIAFAKEGWMSASSLAPYCGAVLASKLPNRSLQPFHREGGV